MRVYLLSGFILAVEMTTKQVAAVPIKSKGLEEVQEALTELIETSVLSRIRTLISDKESSILSRKFRQEIKKRHGTEVYYVSRRHKSFLAELYIAKIKTHLSMAVESNKAAGDPDYRNWTKLLPGVLANLNRKFVSGTKFRRNSVDETNFDEMLGQKHDMQDSSLMWNTRTISDSSIVSKKWKKRIFKFDVGQKVLVSKRALKSKDVFEKPSVHGGYDAKACTVKARSLASTRSCSLVPGTCHLISLNLHFLYAPSTVYRLAEVKGTFYQTELLPLRGPQSHDDLRDDNNDTAP